MIRFFAFLLLLAVAVPSYAYDEDIGLLSPRKGGIDKNAYDALTREALFSMVNNIRPDLDAFRRDLTRTILLSDAEPPKPEAETALEAEGEGEATDFLALRLTKLIELGYFKDALTLYQKANKSDLPQETEKLGMMAALFLGQNDLACLEYRAGKREDWPRLAMLCKTITDKELSEDETLDSPLLAPWFETLNGRKLESAVQFDSLTLEEKAFLFATKPGAITTESPDSPLAILYRLHTPEYLNTASYFAEIYRSALEYGLPVPDLASVKPQYLEGDRFLQDIQTYLNEDRSSNDQIADMNDILTQSTDLSPDLFTPVFNAKAPPSILDSLSGNARLYYALLARYNYKTPNLPSLDTPAPEWPVNTYIQNTSFDEIKLEKWAQNYCSNNNKALSDFFCFRVMHLILNSLSERDKEKFINLSYENLFSLTLPFYYVMPIYVVMEEYPKQEIQNHIGYNLLYLLSLERFNPSLWEPNRFMTLLSVFDAAFSDEALKKRLVLRTMWSWKNDENYTKEY